MLGKATVTGIYMLVLYGYTIDAHKEGAQCPIVFEENSDVTAFSDYCQRLSFSLARIPGQYRQDICFSKCRVHSTCVYYTYKASITHCVVCLRRAERFGDLNTGSELISYLQVPGRVFSRIGIQLNADACGFLDYSCASRWFGGPAGEFADIQIASTEHITALHFCEHSGWKLPLGGFKVVIDDSLSEVRGCLYPVWEPARYDFSDDEVITGIDVYYDDIFVNGLRMSTNLGGGVEAMGLNAANGDQLCFLEGRDLAAIETRSGYVLDAIRFRFKDCE